MLLIINTYVKNIDQNSMYIDKYNSLFWHLLC